MDFFFCSFDASSWPQLDHLDSSKNQRGAVVQPSCISGLHRQKVPWTPPFTALGGLSKASSMSASWNTLPPCFLFLHIEVFWGEGELRRNATGMVGKPVRIGTAPWIRLDIFHHQLWHGYLPESTQRKERGTGVWWEEIKSRHCLCLLPIVYKSR